jgi:hypothetical protein
MGKLDQILESHLLFERVTDVGVQQLTLKQQLENTIKTVSDHTVEQQRMAKQMAETGRAVAELTLNQMRDEEDTESDSDGVSEMSTELKHFHKVDKGKNRGNEAQEDQSKFPKHHMPKVFYPKFNGDNPVIWKDKCVDYFLLVDLDPKH